MKVILSCKDFLRQLLSKMAFHGMELNNLIQDGLI